MERKAAESEWERKEKEEMKELALRDAKELWKMIMASWLNGFSVEGLYRVSMYDVAW